MDITYYMDIITYILFILFHSYNVKKRCYVIIIIPNPYNTQNPQFL